MLLEYVSIVVALGLLFESLAGPHRSVLDRTIRSSKQKGTRLTIDRIEDWADGRCCEEYKSVQP
jgi:hypothetical protein